MTRPDWWEGQVRSLLTGFMGNLTLVHLVDLLAVRLDETGVFILFQAFLPGRERRPASWNNKETSE